MTTITVEEFKTRFVKNFIFGTETDQVSDTDIQNAINDALCSFNQDLLPVLEYGINISQIAFGYLTAHFCLQNLDEQTMGAQPAFLQSSRSVNGMSESLDIPEFAKAQFASFCTSSFGLKYINIILPYTIGTMYAIGGFTVP
jgi:hypothetical protein